MHVFFPFVQACCFLTHMCCCVCVTDTLAVSTFGVFLARHVPRPNRTTAGIAARARRCRVSFEAHPNTLAATAFESLPKMATGHHLPLLAAKVMSLSLPNMAHVSVQVCDQISAPTTNPQRWPACALCMPHVVKVSGKPTRRR